MFKQVIFAALIASAFGLPKPRLPRLDGRIVGGEDANIEDYPYQISLLQYGSHICGGSILTDQVIVTAAHCVYGANVDTLSIRAGSSIRNSGGIVIKIKASHEHPQYDRRTNDYDVAILELADLLSFGENIAPISLHNEDPSDGTPAQCTGWGRLVAGGSSPSQLQVVTVPIVNREECDDAYGGSITDRMICAGYPEGGKDACQGDSGGPLAAEGKLAGIVSWGKGCAEPDYPGVYSDVPALLDFITAHL